MSSQMANGSLRHVSHSTKGNGKTHAAVAAHDHSGDADHDSEHGHSHTHSQSIFGGHSHSRDNGPNQDVESIVKALEGKADRGSRITLLGLVVNVGLTVSKGAAGWYMNSAALLAEAGHSASDLLGDFVTLFAWRFSRRTPTAKYPYGFGKFETLGTTTVSLILIGGALGIGVHSFTLLTDHLLQAAATLPPGPAQVLVQNVTDVAQTVSSAMHTASAGLLDGHGHAHPHIHAHAPVDAAALADAAAHALDPNAAWFAAVSVLAKEWLYRATKRVADAERSSVLLANAVHHRADAYSSAVALAAILGTWWFPALPLDPLGGLLVSLVILRQGAALFAGAFGELTDAGVAPRTRRALGRALQPLVAERGALQAVEDVRAMRAGALLFVDVRARVPGALPVGDAAVLETRIRDALLDVRSEIAEVRIKFVPSSPSTDEKGDGAEKMGEEGRS